MKVISYNEPVYWNGTFIGVVGIEIDYTTMAEQVDSIQLYKDGYAFINDSDGYLVYHPRLTDDELEVERNREAPYGMIEDNTLIRYTYNGVEKEGVWLPLSNDMRLNVTVPVSEINSEWHKWINETVIVSIILLILFIVLTMVLSGRITKPLQDLTKAAEQVVEGNYDVSLNYKGEDEVGILSRAFNHLTSHLQAYIRDLRDLAYGDALTAVRNKGAFDIYMKNMQAQLEDPSQETPEFAVCFFDCNNLKQINDQHGHDKGDLYLKRACKTICQIFSHSPVFRIGGDEFAAILQNKDYESRKDLIRIFDQRCFDLRAVGKDPWERVDVARGMAVYDPKKDASVEDVVRRADERMYENKRVRKGKPE